MINLFDTNLFEYLTSIQEGNSFFDIHNNFVCTNFSYKQDTKRLKILFKNTSNNERDVNEVCIIFNRATIVGFELYLSRINDSSTLNDFYRGRFETSEGLAEYSQLNEAYFYLEFERGDKFEVLAQEVLFFQIS